jgi:hypothetical protein
MGNSLGKEMTMKWIRVGMMVGVLFGLSGCSSYRLSGDHTPVQPHQFPDAMFRLRNYEMQSTAPFVVDGIGSAIGNTALTSVSKNDVERALRSTYPDLFSRSSSAIPLDVKVTLTDSKLNMWGSLVSLATLCVVPGGRIYTETCDVDVHVEGLNDLQKAPETLKLRSNVWVSFTPLGLILPSEPVGYSGAQRTGHGTTVALNDEGCENRDAVFIEEVVAGIANAVTHRDRNDLKRAALLRGLSEN